MYAVGDVTSVGTPKAGVFAEGQAAVVADAIIARHRGATGVATTYDGRGICYLEFGDDQVATRRRHVPERPDAGGAVRRTLRGHRRRQGRVRLDAHPALVRSGVDHPLNQLLPEPDLEHTAVGRCCLGHREEPTMKVRNSLRSLKDKPGSTVVRRHGRTVVVNKLHPRWKARQG